MIKGESIYQTVYVIFYKTMMHILIIAYLKKTLVEMKIVLCCLIRM